MDCAMKGGVGTYALEIGQLKVGAIVAVNAFGDVIEGGKTLAGVYDRENKTFLQTEQIMVQGAHQKPFNGNTTIGLVVTNGKFTKAAMNKIASMSHNGYGRALFPSHTMVDGDTIFAAATGEVDSDPSLAGHFGAVVMEKAIHRAVKTATSLHGVLAYQDLK
jgi:L-aminopeptidase/D-esterase-like protein